MNECQKCGACCSHFRVSFHWMETSQLNRNPVPIHFTKSINQDMLCMDGTNQPQSKCVCLTGKVGQDVGCSIYENRSSTCKEVEPGDAQCNKARLAHGLTSIEMELAL